MLSAHVRAEQRVSEICRGKAGGGAGSEAWGAHSLCVGGRFRHLVHCDTCCAFKKTKMVE